MRSTDDPRNIFYTQRQDTEPSQETMDTPPKGYEEKVEEMKRLAKKYEKEGEGQLVKDIVNNVIEQKAAGNLTNDQLKAFAKRVWPLLNAEQRTRLSGLLEQLLKL